MNKKQNCNSSVATDADSSTTSDVTTSSQTIGKPHVVGSQIFIAFPPPSDVRFYDVYIERRNEFDKKYKLLLKHKLLSKESYVARRHVYSLDPFIASDFPKFINDPRTMRHIEVDECSLIEKIGLTNRFR